MKVKIIGILLILAMMFTMWGCGEEKTTTLTGMVVSLDGTTLSVIETDGTTLNRGDGDRTRPTGEDGSIDFSQMFGGNFDPSNMEGFDPGSMGGFDPGSMGDFIPGSMGGFDPNNMEGFDPESFGGSFPQGGEKPTWGEGEMPEGFMPGEGGFTPGEGGFTPGEGGFSFGGGKGTFDPSAMGIDGETKTVDITNAHISVDNNGTKESGTTENLTPGAIVTITLNKKGEATYILVTSTGRRFGGRGGSQG